MEHESYVGNVLSHKRFNRGKSTTIVALVVLTGFLILFFFPIQRETVGLKTLRHIRAFAARKTEHPSIDGENLVIPDYTSFLRQDAAGSFERRWRALLRRLGLSYGADLTPEFFEHELKRQAYERRHKKYHGEIVHKLLISKNMKFVVWGDLQGALHSFVRDLDELQRQDVIDDNLKLISPNSYIVFLGDVIGRSPYIMATLSIIMRLMEQNPDQIIFLRGGLELNNNWMHGGLEREMKARAHKLSRRKIPLEHEINLFLNTLPRALYLQVPHHSVLALIRFSHVGRDKKDIVHEDLYGNFLFSGSKEGLKTFHADPKHPHAGSMIPHIKAIVKSEKKPTAYSPDDGLRFLKQDRGSTAWSVLSCPTEPYQKILNFYTDSFAVLDVGTDIDKWTITHYAQDIRKKEGFSTTSYAFFTGTRHGVEEEKGEEITDYSADLILYTCEDLSSPIKIIKYARLLEI